MVCWLLLLNDGGFPLFSRSYGLPSSAFSFPTMGLLSAVHSSAGNSGFGVTRMSSADGDIVYRMYTGGLILVLATSDTHTTPEYLTRRLGLIYDALLFLVGRMKLHDMRHVERTKRWIRSAGDLLAMYLIEDAHLLQMGTGVPECCLASNADQLFQHVRTLASACGTHHAALYAQHRMYAWTTEWSEIDSRDLFTISCFLRSCTPAQARDVPVYLAHSSLGGAGAAAAPSGNSAATGKTPYRLLTIALVHELELVMLCGPTPALVDAMATVQRTILATPSTSASSSSSSSSHSKSGFLTQELSLMHSDLLAGCADFPRHLPNDFSFHPGMLGFVFFAHDDLGGSSSAGGGPGEEGATQAASSAHRSRLVCSFLPSPPAPSPSSTPSVSSSSSGAASPSKKSDRRRAGAKGRSPSLSPRASRDFSFVEPPSPSGGLAPTNPLFSSSLLSEASVLTRSHALLGFYHLMREELIPPPPPAAVSQEKGETTSASAEDGTHSPASSPPSSAASSVSAPQITEVYMLTATRGFYAVRRGPFSLYAMFAEKVAQLHHAPLTWQLMEKLEAIIHRLT